MVDPCFHAFNWLMLKPISLPGGCFNQVYAALTLFFFFFWYEKDPVVSSVIHYKTFIFTKWSVIKTPYTVIEAKTPPLIFMVLAKMKNYIIHISIYIYIYIHIYIHLYTYIHIHKIHICVRKKYEGTSEKDVHF